MVIENALRRFVSCRPYVRKDGSKGCEILFLDGGDNSVTTFYVTQNLADDTHLSSAEIGDVFEVDIEVLQSKYGVRMVLKDARFLCKSADYVPFLDSYGFHAHLNDDKDSKKKKGGE